MRTTHADLTYSTLAETGEQIRTRQLSPVELTNALLERIERLNPKLNAFITVTPELALEQAKQAERDIMNGIYKGPLHGIPIAHKDLYYTKGIRTTASSKALDTFVPDYDATTVVKLAEAGTILLGKVQTHEFAAGALTNSSHFGPCLNPWDMSKSPGGSSGGSGSAVAAGLIFMGTGSDTGGSIRIPAALCGVVGMKPTYGRVSRKGIFPLAWSLDHSGPLTRSVKDAALCLQAMAGYDPEDASTVNKPVPDYSALLRTDLRGVKIGVPANYYCNHVEPAIEAAFREAVRELEKLGAVVVEVGLKTVEHAPAALMSILYGEMASIHAESFKENPALYGADLQASLTAASLIPATAYLQAQRVRQLIRQDFESALSQVDVIVTPTVPVMTPSALHPEDGSRRLAEFTLPTDITGHPTLSLPCGVLPGGMPAGMQIIGRAFEEGAVMGIGHVYEQNTIWHTMRPDL